MRFGTDEKMVVYAATAPYDDPNSINCVRIDGWKEFQEMTTYGRNTDNGCGFTAMAILLQYYNDFTKSSGEILPDNFDYNLETGTLGNNTRANALRQDLKSRTPRLLGGLGNQIDKWFTSLSTGNATAAKNHKDGLNSFFQANNLNINASHFDWHNAGNIPITTHVTFRAIEQIKANRPVIMTILSYEYTGASTGSGTIFGGGMLMLSWYMAIDM